MPAMPASPRTAPRRRRTQQLAGMAAAAVVSLRGGTVEAQPFSPLGEADHIICFGDSLTAGHGASPGLDYPSLLARALGRPVVNAGVGGDTTSHALRRLKRDVLARDPRLVIVEFGGNDYLRGLPMARMFANLETLVRRIQAHGATVVLVGVLPSLFEAMREGYETIVQRCRIAFVPDVLHGIVDNPHMKSDDLHPNDSGYALMATRISQAVRRALPAR